MAVKQDQFVLPGLQWCYGRYSKDCFRVAVRVRDIVRFDLTPFLVESKSSLNPILLSINVTQGVVGRGSNEPKMVKFLVIFNGS
jgi:hypothetical protein